MLQNEDMMHVIRLNCNFSTAQTRDHSCQTLGQKVKLICTFFTPKGGFDMMNDDDKLNEGKEIKEVQENASKEAEAETPTEDVKEDAGEKKMGKVIPFDPQAEANLALESAQSALNDAVASMKTAFSNLKEQMAPLAEGLREIKNTINESAQNAKAAADEAAQERKAAETETADEKADETTADRAQNAGVAAVKEASELLNLGVEKLKKRSANLKFNLKDVVAKEFEDYADKNLKDGDYIVDENGKRVVKVDGKFMQEHGNEVVPAILRGAVGSFLKAVLGTDPIKNAEKPAEDEALKAADIKEDDSARESKYHVEFDFAEALGNAIRNAQVSPAAETEEEVHNREQGREVLIESARIVEDTLNGKPAEDAKDRLEAAMNRPDMAEADKAPEDIQAIDEKHQKILEMSKQFEKDMNPDK